MAYTLDDCFQHMEETYGLARGVSSSESDHLFVQRKLNSDPRYQLDFANGTRYDRPYFDHLANEIFMFSLYMRHAPVRKMAGASSSSESVFLCSRKDLVLLRQQRKDALSWNDSRLWTLYRRTSLRPADKKVRSYIETLDDLGSDQEVIRLWEGPITYARDIRYILRQGSVYLPHPR